MKLTEKEEQERIYLEGLKSSRTIVMMQNDQDRLKFLNAKEFHNCCPNPQCTGYDGSDIETICPICNSNLIKSI